jgi:hypothetical protein
MKLYFLLFIGAFYSSTCFAQEHSVTTNGIYLNTKKIDNKPKKFPIIKWLEPTAQNTETNDQFVNVKASVFSVSMLKSLQLFKDGVEILIDTELTKFTESSIKAELSIEKQITLTNGENKIEIIAENIAGGKVSATRLIYADQSELLQAKEDNTKGTPILYIKENSVVFEDANGDALLSGNESAKVKFVLGNRGKATARNLKFSYSLKSSTQGIQISQGIFPKIEANTELPMEVTITADSTVTQNLSVLQFVVLEPKGFDSDSVKIQFNTEAFKSPQVLIADLVFNSVRSNTLKRNAPAGFQVLIQNTGLGHAENVSVTIEFPENIFYDGEKITYVGNLGVGESRKLSYEFIPTTRYKSNEIPIKIKLAEKFGKFGSEKTVTPVIDQPLTSLQFNIVNEKKEPRVAAAALRSDVDINIPVTVKNNSNRYALVIGNEDYVQFQPLLRSEQNVAFAKNDAIVFRDYLIKTLGTPEKNVFMLLDGTKGQITRELDRICELAKLHAQSEIIFYYAGHGLPDFETRKGYIIPVDVSGTNIKDGLALSDLYSKLASANATKSVVFIDACFSGGGRGENGLLAARSVKVKPVGDIVDGNIVVFTATSSEEVSLPLQRESHGLFTYHLLRSFKQTAGNFSLDELKNYLEIEVPKSSLIENGIKQTPQVLVSPKLEQEWLLWKF